MSYLQDLYQGDREIFAHEHRDDRDLAEALRARGYAVQMDAWTMYGRQTDALMGQSYAIKGVARGEQDIMELQSGDSVDDGYDDSRRYTLMPHGHVTADEILRALEEPSLEEMGQEVARIYTETYGPLVAGEEILF